MRLGRDEQFRSYVLDQRSALLRTATLLTAGDGHLAEDLVQATLTRLYVSWPLFAKAANRDAYARRALSNALMDEHRRPWRRHERPSTVVPERATEDTADSSERVEALNRALRELPPRMRAAVVYRYFHDLSVADTADALSCSQGTVKSQTARALDRGHSALRRRRAGRLSAGTGLVAAAAVGTFVLIGPHDSPGAPSTGPSTSTTQRATPVELVAYTGEQPVGFTLDEVPAGWSVADSTTTALTLAPKGAALDEPSDGTSFVGKIAITTQDEGAPAGVELAEVTVGSRPAVVMGDGTDGTRTLFVQDPSGRYVSIQVWKGLGWDDARIAEFASSVHLTDDAQSSVG